MLVKDVGEKKYVGEEFQDVGEEFSYVGERYVGEETNLNVCW